MNNIAVVELYYIAVLGIIVYDVFLLILNFSTYFCTNNFSECKICEPKM